MDESGYITHPYKNFIHTSRYARWIAAEQRRENWVETVNRYVDFMVGHLKENNSYIAPDEDVRMVKEYILSHMSLPSMRALMTAGPALERENIAGYNCSYLPIEDLICLDEVLYILMNGTGVGFSVENKYVSKLPVLPQLWVADTADVIVVQDSKEGWAAAYRALINQLMNGVYPRWDVSLVRPAGSRLNTFGGRASGPEPLVELFEFTVKMFEDNQGKKLRDIDVHDLVCKIASVVVVGGVRRSALISLSDLDSENMATAKSGAWWEAHPHRALANISAVYDRKPSKELFNREFDALIASGSGERGIFSRYGSELIVQKNEFRESGHEWGTNPCSEIILRPYQFCNLSTIVVRENDTIESLEEKAVGATILGTWQSTLTNFNYLRPIWKKNTEEERLLGVSMTGVYGSKLLNGKISKEKTENILEHLKNLTIEVNEELAEAIGINSSAAITCIKPEGTTSQFCLTSSGLHSWHSPYYVRTVRSDKKDPLSALMVDMGVPFEDDFINKNAYVFSFPVAAPEEAITRNDMSAVDHLEMWLLYQRHWCEHKPSVTVSVRDGEWEDVRLWVYDHFDEISGVSFLPHSDHTYQQAPYQEINKDQYDKLVEKFPKNLDWSLLKLYEYEDNTTGTQELNCTAGACDVVDLLSV